MKNYLKWIDYFKQNRSNFDFYPVSHERPELSRAERLLILSSIQQFQKGENSEGQHLIEYSRELKDPSYEEAIQLFIREEQRHAMILKRYMDAEGIPTIKSHWVDGFFRRFRNLFSLEHSVMVLITAEIIAEGYYLALSRCTNSTVLTSICDQILKDEVRHIDFQSYTLHLYHREKTGVQKTLGRLFHQVLMMGTLGVVWLYHSQIFRAAGFTLMEYLRFTWRRFKRSEDMVTNPEKIRKVVTRIQPTV